MDRLIRDMAAIAELVDERSDGLCELCTGNNMVQKHHIIKGQGKRTQCQTQYSVKNLCWECHHGTYGIHGKYGATLDMALKQRLQETYFNMGYTEEEVRELMGGRLYAGLNNSKE